MNVPEDLLAEWNARLASEGLAAFADGNRFSGRELLASTSDGAAIHGEWWGEAHVDEPVFLCGSGPEARKAARAELDRLVEFIPSHLRQVIQVRMAHPDGTQYDWCAEIGISQPSLSVLLKRAEWALEAVAGAVGAYTLPECLEAIREAVRALPRRPRGTRRRKVRKDQQRGWDRYRANIESVLTMYLTMWSTNASVVGLDVSQPTAWFWIQDQVRRERYSLDLPAEVQGLITALHGMGRKRPTSVLSDYHSRTRNLATMPIAAPHV